MIPSLIFFISLLSQSSFAFIPTVTKEGTPIRWKTPMRLNLIGNPITQSGVTPAQFYNAAVQGLQRWSTASSEVLKFDYWQGTTKENFPTTGAYDGTSSIYFISNADPSSHSTHLSPNVLGMTQVWYNTQSGEILETDIVLNDQNFYFTDNPADTSGFGGRSARFTQGKSNVYIQNVITHELGHAFGLSHSGGLQSTMLYMESPEQAYLGCDEQIGIHSLYPTSDAPKRGGFSGKVLSESGVGVFGAHVVAISHNRGTVLATTLTDSNGRYEFTALEPGTYSIMAEPFYAGPSALPQFYSLISPGVCDSGATFSRSFLTFQGLADLVPIFVTASNTLAAPNLTVQCRSNLTPQSASQNRQKGFAVIDRITPNTTHEYRLENLAGHFEVHALDYSLYSPIHTSLTLASLDGTPIPVQASDPVFEGASGYKDYDSALSVDGLAAGTYRLTVTATELQSNDYPAGPVSLDPLPFLALIGTSTPLQSPSPMPLPLPQNARCHFDDPQRNYSSPLTKPARQATASKQDGGTSTGCGRVQDVSRTRSKGDQTRTLFVSFVNFCLQWALILSFPRFLTLLRAPTKPVKLEG